MGAFKNEMEKASSLIFRFDSIKKRHHGLIQLSKRVWSMLRDGGEA